MKYIKQKALISIPQLGEYTEFDVISLNFTDGMLVMQITIIQNISSQRDIVLKISKLN